jgi:hypothetical protein
VRASRSLSSNPFNALEAFVIAVMSQQVGAECVDGPPLHELRGRPQVVQSASNLLRRLVGEGEGIDARGVDALPRDEESDPFDETIRLAGARTGEHERGTEGSLDRGEL